MTRIDRVLPIGWAWGQIEDTGRYINGFAFKPEHWGAEGRPIIRIQNLTDPTREFNRTTFNAPDGVRVVPGEILVSWSATLDAFIWQSEPAFLNQHIFRVIPAETLVTHKFLFYLLKESIWEMTKTEHLHGSTMRHINRGPFMAFPVPIPPKGEQIRIVEEIEKQFTRLDAAVAALKRVQANLKRYRAAVLKAACEGRLVPTEAELARRERRSYEPATELLKRILAERRARWEASQKGKTELAAKPPAEGNWRARYRHPAEPKIAALPELPEGWMWASVESLSTKVVDGVHKKPVYVENGIPFVTVKNLTAGPGISFDDLKYVTEKDHREFIRRTDPGENDLLITKDGTLGVVRKVRTKKEFSIFVSVAMIKPVLSEMSDYLEVALSSPQVQIQMVPKGSGLQHIHLEDLRQDCVPIAPLQEQSRITLEVSRRVSVIDEIERALVHELKRAATLRQSVLKCAFEGNLVRQDPNDEPASALLERIRAEKTHGAPATKADRRPKVTTRASIPAPAKGIQ